MLCIGPLSGHDSCFISFDLIWIFVCLIAAKLPIFLHVHINSDNLVLVRLHIFMGYPCSWREGHLEGYGKGCALWFSGGVLLHSPMVCWRSDWFSFLPYQHQPGSWHFQVLYDMWFMLVIPFRHVNVILELNLS